MMEQTTRNLFTVALGLKAPWHVEEGKRPVSDKPCYPDRVWEAPVGGGLSIVTGLARLAISPEYP